MTELETFSKIGPWGGVNKNKLDRSLINKVEFCISCEKSLCDA